ncbi:hypothetical protein VMCG_07308 [Cytospora schulzeri]|uniref:Uncharacterized protein n=1 Tax=Cytospora schulzeri TaxID=448051 RepID=A0A423WAI7_9PEZI|nr:hypothetical protein VMCG_07308 [Valsa malicola]
MAMVDEAWSAGIRTIFTVPLYIHINTIRHHQIVTHCLPDPGIPTSLTCSPLTKPSPRPSSKGPKWDVLDARANIIMKVFPTESAEATRVVDRAVVVVAGTMSRSGDVCSSSTIGRELAIEFTVVWWSLFIRTPQR